MIFRSLDLTQDRLKSFKLHWLLKYHVLLGYVFSECARQESGAEYEVRFDYLLSLTLRVCILDEAAELLHCLEAIQPRHLEVEQTKLDRLDLF